MGSGLIRLFILYCMAKAWKRRWSPFTSDPIGKMRFYHTSSFIVQRGTDKVHWGMRLSRLDETFSMVYPDGDKPVLIYDRWYLLPEESVRHVLGRPDIRFGTVSGRKWLPSSDKQRLYYSFIKGYEYLWRPLKGDPHGLFRDGLTMIWPVVQEVNKAYGKYWPRLPQAKMNAFFEELIYFRSGRPWWIFRLILPLSA